jgi:hypothetical protein
VSYSEIIDLFNIKKKDKMILNVNINYSIGGLIGGCIKKITSIKPMLNESSIFDLGAVLGALCSLFPTWEKVSTDNFFFTITYNHERKNER